MTEAEDEDEDEDEDGIHAKKKNSFTQRTSGSKCKPMRDLTLLGHDATSVYSMIR